MLSHINRRFDDLAAKLGQVDSRVKRGVNRILAKLDKVEAKLEGLKTMSAETDQAVADLTAEISDLKTAEDAAVVLINSIPDLMAAAGVPAATIAGVTASLKANAQPLLDAIAKVGTTPAPPGPVIDTPPPGPAPDTATGTAQSGGTVRS